MSSNPPVLDILLDRWVDELTKLSELMEVLHRSVLWTELEYGGDRDTRIAMGDDELVKIIRDRLIDLFGEIQDFKSGILDK